MSSFQRMKEIISVINDVKESVGFDIALHLFNISKSTFYSWSFQVKHYCHDSFFGKCIRRWPNQLPLSSVEIIKSLCNDDIFKGWPMVSIAFYARREKILNVSVNTWYKYARLIGITSKTPRCLKKLRIPVKSATHSGFKFTTFNPFPFSKSPLFRWQVSSRIFCFFLPHRRSSNINFM